MCGPYRRIELVLGLVCLSLIASPRPLDAQQFTVEDQSLKAFGLEPATKSAPAPVVTAVDINDDGTLLATGGDNGLVNVWRIADGSHSATLRGHKEWVRAV